MCLRTQGGFIWNIANDCVIYACDCRLVDVWAVCNGWCVMVDAEIMYRGIGSESRASAGHPR